MKQRKITKKAMAFLLAVGMIITSFPILSHEVYAADNVLPDSTKFATAEQLKSFNTATDGNSAKVYFGQNNQQWWIAGSQNGNLTLLAASPLETNQQFESSWDSEKTYDEDWGCTYVAGSPINVWSSHYGASPLRNKLRNLETTYFSSSEQDLMNTTTIYTDDAKNNTVYSITEKLYLAYGKVNDDYITVGTNSIWNLSDGLRVNRDYFGNPGSNFWLRASGTDYNGIVLNADKNSFVYENYVFYEGALVPAFELEISTVLFGSAVPTVSSNGEQNTDGAFTLRYSTDTLGSAQVSYDKLKVNLSNVPNGTYLVIQNSNGAYAKAVSGTTSISAKDMGLDNFANCKVWLETTNDRVTYATLAKESQGYNINVIGNDTLKVTNDTQEVLPGAEISNVTVKAENGYYFNDEYVEQLKNQSNGLTVTKTDDYTLTITGTPTNDVSITLPAAPTLPKADIPDVEITKTSTSIKAVVTNHQGIFGNIEYKWDNGSWQQDNDTLSDLTPNTKYQLAVRFTGQGIYQQSEEYSAEITTLKDGNALIVEPTDLKGVYEQKLSDVTLDNGWKWADETTSLTVGTQKYSAYFDTTNYENDNDFSGINGYDSAAHRVVRDLEVVVDKAESKIEITTQNMDKVYDGKKVSNPEVNKTGSPSEVTFTWYQETKARGWKELNGAPTSVGTYKVVASVAEDRNYKAANAEKEFNISRADNEWVDELSITGWTYGQSANTPTANAKFGTVEFTYSATLDGTYDKTVPTNAGTYYVKATVTGNENYTSLESIKEFTIQKEDSNISITTQDMNKVYDGKAVENPTFTKTGSTNDVAFTWYQKQADGTWKELDSAPINVGNYKVVVSVTEDTNYNGASIEKEFSISIADNKWTKQLSINDWTYGDNANTPNAKAKFGDVTFLYSSAENGPYTETIPTDAGTWYVKATVVGNENYKGLESAPVKFEITKATSSIKFKDGTAFDKVYDTNAVVVTEEHIERTGSTGAVSFVFEKKVNDKWEEVKAPSEVGTYRVTATLAADNNHTSATSKSLEFTIQKADSKVSITTQDMNKVYDGKAVENPTFKKDGSTNDVVFTWYQKQADGTWKELDSAPVNVGNYKVVASVTEDTNYNGASEEKEFSISIADNEWTEQLSIKDWTYGDNAQTPNAKAKFGDVTFLYSSEENGTYTNEVPKNAGTYYVKATVIGTENYAGLESVVSFEIKKAVPTYEKVTGLVLGQGQPLSKIKLPEQFKWVDEEMTADELGTHTFKAIYTPEDTANYQIIEVDIEVEVVPIPVELNHVPTINAGNTTLKVGDKFEPLKDVTASDQEDGDLTSKIKVIKNTVDTDKAGTYEVTYQVTDSQGATVTKTIQVTVEPKTTVNPDKDKTDNDSVETGDRTNLLLWEVLLMGSSIILLYSLYRRKRKMNQ